MHEVFVSLRWLPRCTYLGHMMNQYFKVAASNFAVLPTVLEGSNFSISLPKLVIGYKFLYWLYDFQIFFSGPCMSFQFF